MCEYTTIVHSIVNLRVIVNKAEGILETPRVLLFSLLAAPSHQTQGADFLKKTHTHTQKNPNLPMAMLCGSGCPHR